MNSADKSIPSNRIGKQKTDPQISNIILSQVEAPLPLNTEFWKETCTPQVKFSTQKTAHELDTDSPVQNIQDDEDEIGPIDDDENEE